mmetsp:Transcript_11857/g.34723  ORF Transcript_11857/g.34723 Transcript_11857/m.34723 type:complete len:277 (+) Transcript_11857:799-1629(+)
MPLPPEVRDGHRALAHPVHLDDPVLAEPPHRPPQQIDVQRPAPHHDRPKVLERLAARAARRVSLAEPVEHRRREKGAGARPARQQLVEHLGRVEGGRGGDDVARARGEVRDVVHACGRVGARVRCGMWCMPAGLAWQGSGKGLGGVREASGERLAGCAGRRAGGVRERRRVQHGLLRPDRVQVGQEGAALRAQVLVGEHRRLWSTGRARGEEEPRRRACLHRSHPVEQRVRRRALERARSVALEERRVPLLVADPQERNAARGPTRLLDGVLDSGL